MTGRSVTEVGTEMRSYYGRPVLKPPVWKPEIPWYLFTGGLGGASSFLAQLARERGNDELAARAMWIALAADTVSPLLLISDLGRPERFHHMLRVFKVTSPMNVGTWILAGSGTANGIAALAQLLGLRRTRNAAEHAAGLLGMPLATYTGVLLADTAIPVWHEARFELPLVFGTSAAASAGAAAAIVVSPENAGPARRIAVGAALAENVAMQAMELRLGMLAEPYREGESGRLNRLAKALTLGGAAVIGLAGKRRLGAVLGGGLLLAGEACLRWSVFKAGFRSALDPRYTVEPQRERADARRAAGDPGPNPSSA